MGVFKVSWQNATSNDHCWIYFLENLEFSCWQSHFLDEKFWGKHLRSPKFDTVFVVFYYFPCCLFDLFLQYFNYQKHCPLHLSFTPDKVSSTSSLSTTQWCVPTKIELNHNTLNTFQRFLSTTISVSLTLLLLLFLLLLSFCDVYEIV